MRLKIVCLALIVFIALPRSLYAVLGIGDTVTDPGSYLYYIQQIEQMTEMLNKTQQQVETLGGIKTVTDDVKRQLYRVHDQFVGAIETYKRANESLTNAVNNTPNTIDKLFSIDRDSITTSPNDGGVFYKETAELIDDMFKATETMPVAEFLHINDEKLRGNIRKDLSQLAWKKFFTDMNASLTRSNDRQARVTKSMVKVAELAKSDESISVAEMQVQIATLLAELIQLQSEMLQLQRDLAYAQALEKYEGVDFDKTKERLNSLKDEDPTRRENYYKANTPKWQGKSSNYNFDEKMKF
jgi:carbon monoxide dehydrogenase subunit G